MDFKLSSFIVFSEIPSEIKSDIRTMLYSTRSGKTVILNQKNIENIQNQEFELLSSELTEILIQNKIIIPDFEDEFLVCLEENKSYLKDFKTLSYTIQPTGNCQLGCTYCGQEHRNITMGKEVMDKIFERIVNLSNNGNYEKMEITWYGGEPLMGIKEIKYLSNLLIDHCKTTKISYSADIITNGLALTPDKLTVLVKECQIKSYQITIDGLPEFHDKTRFTKLGKGSFETIFSNVKKFAFNDSLYREENCGITIRMNINKLNYNGVIPFIDFLAENGLSNKVGIDFIGIVDWGDNNASQDSLSITEFAERKIDWMFHAMDKGFTFSDIIPQRQYGVCMVVDKNSEVYDAYGNIYPCYELPYTPVHENGPNLIGNLMGGNEKPVGEIPLRNWNELVTDKSFGCNKCKFFPVCGGGCPKSWLAGDIPCPPFKFNMEQLLLIEYVNKNLVK